MIRTLLTDFLHLFFPRVCLLCGQPLVDGEHEICLACLHGQPHTHLAEKPDNRMEQLFWGKVEAVQRAAALFYFEKGSGVQQLIHQLKYKDNPEVGHVLGRYAAHEMASSPLAKTDAIIPVPLHPKRLRKRGYNQSALIAEGLANVWGTPVNEHLLKRISANDTQTHKGVYERWENTQGLFETTDTRPYRGKTLLLVDDVVTTGSTLCAAAEALSGIPGVTIHCLCLAIAR